ncbi:MAG: complex I NDUFA9 subunit family protein [Proteobacteria bacterium]|jgi:NADH dehydrogenase|nr:complex I NDUFA9 subunit family protein [Alphaproteobacteria bacterium]NCC03659.1 complex I NDUFA9 subunit family protein [Pseudomonadota bacterium]
MGVEPAVGKGRTVTVFGGTGLVGHAVVQLLAKQGYTVRVPTRDLEKAQSLKPLGSVGQIIPLLCSLRTETSLSTALSGTEIVINLLGALYETKESSFQSLHVETAARLARLAHGSGVTQLVHLSAVGAKIGDVSLYLRTKAVGEEAVRAFFPEAIIFRPNLIFGPKDRFFNMFALASRYLPFLPLFGGGQMQLQPVYVGDVAKAIVTAIEPGRCVPGVYSLAGPETFSMKEIVELLLRLTKRKRFLVPVPWPLAKLKARFFELWPEPLMTREHVELLKRDYLSDSSTKNGFLVMGFSPRALSEVWPTYLF